MPVACLLLLGAVLSGCLAQRRNADLSVPPVVDPGPAPEAPVLPPSDALVLFDGTHLTHWQHANGNPPAWRVADGYVEVVPHSGSLVTKQAFGDVQLHVEWAAPLPVRGRGQGRGNSGVKLMERYEVQVLDSYENPTYPDGQAGAVYAQYPPLVNASRPPGQWQTYDILFRRPRFATDGTVRQPASLTVWHNGVLVQDHVALAGPTGSRQPAYDPHPDRLPILLQDHRDRVRYRAVWVRDLEGDLPR